MDTCSSSVRRDSLLSQLDLDDILDLGRNTSCMISARSNIDHNSNLQVVPDLDTRDNSTAGLERELTGLHFTWPIMTLNMASSNTPRINNEVVPRSPFLPKTSISEIDNMGILSPLFSIANADSPILKTPSTLYEICCSSRKSSDDLSIYLPDDFTPASLESLDKSVNRTVFQFPANPAKIETIRDNVFVEINDKNETSSQRFVSIDLDEQEVKTKSTRMNSLITSQHTPNEKLDEVKSLLDITAVKKKREKKKRAKEHSKLQCVKRQKCDVEPQATCMNASSKEKESSPLLRNVMERQRRNDLNNRFQKLRESLPDDVAKGNISKVSVLKAATAFINELICQETSLERVSKMEKKRNEELLKKLVSISENLGDK